MRLMIPMIYRITTIGPQLPWESHTPPRETHTPPMETKMKVGLYTLKLVFPKFEAIWSAGIIDIEGLNNLGRIVGC